MSKVLLNISVLNKNYCIFEKEKGSKLNASFYDKKTKEFGFVTNQKELTILNEIIRKLNRKYIRRRDVIFNDENFIRYVNRYTGMSYFAKMENGSPQSCPYLEYKDLYNEYNGKQIFCMARRPNKRRSSPYDYNNNYNSNYRSGYDNYKDLWDEPIPRKRYKGHKAEGIAKKIVIVIAGVAISASITFGGYKVLSASSLPDLEAANAIIAETDEPENSLKDFDTKADTDAQKALKEKYDSIAKQFETAGLEPWEIALQLDIISVFEEDKDNISFYYDNDKNEVVYIYEAIERARDKFPKADIQVSDDIQRIIQAINSNSKLSEAEKSHIIDTYTPIWSKNEQYLNIYELINRFSMLETEFDYIEGGKISKESLTYNPHERIAGTYLHRGILAQGEEDLGNCFESKITIHDAESFDDTMKDDNKTSTFDHESNHINGNLSYYTASLLNEGYTQLSQANSTDRYKTEAAMAMLCVEAFGDEAFREGFYGFDLQIVLTNKIAGITKRDVIEVDSEIYELFEDIETVLYSARKR